jgi:translation initiation factor 2-alpha kinase 4
MLPDSVAFETASQLKAAFQAGIPTLAIDVPLSVFHTMTKSSAWITDDEAWKPILSAFPPGQSGYAGQVREAAAKHKMDHRFLLLFAAKEELVQVLAL